MAKGQTNAKQNSSPKRLPRREKVEATKTLRKKGFTYTEIAEWLGIGESTAKRYMTLQTPEDLTNFETEFSTMIQIMKYDGIGKVYKRVNELIPNERRIDQVVKAGEFLEGRQTGTTLNNNFNFNVVREEPIVIDNEEK